VEAILSEVVAKAENAYALATAAVDEVTKLKRQLISLQALDTRSQEMGKLIFMFEINGKARVRIWDIPKAFTVEEYRALSESIHSQYGARPEFVDDSGLNV